jgi:hypothetical protein
MLSTELLFSAWLLEWGLPAWLGIAAATGYVLGWRVEHQAAARKAAHLKHKAATAKHAPAAWPESTQSGGTLTEGLIWHRLPGDMLEIEGGSGFYIHCSLDKHALFVLRDPNHCIVARGADLSALMTQGEALAARQAAAARCWTRPALRGGRSA